MYEHWEEYFRTLGLSTVSVLDFASAEGTSYIKKNSKILPFLILFLWYLLYLI